MDGWIDAGREGYMRDDGKGTGIGVGGCFFSRVDDTADCVTRTWSYFTLLHLLFYFTSWWMDGWISGWLPTLCRYIISAEMRFYSL